VVGSGVVRGHSEDLRQFPARSGLDDPVHHPDDAQDAVPLGDDPLAEQRSGQMRTRGRHQVGVSLET
jgi:hypothetical protein